MSAAKTAMYARSTALNFVVSEDDISMMITQMSQNLNTVQGEALGLGCTFVDHAQNRV